jgi:K+-transporting ATPase ATPase C chain
MNPALLDEVKARIALLRASGVTGAIPADLVTKSASGLDPHVSPAAAEIQVARIAATRKLPEANVRTAIAQHTESSTFGLLGEPRVNVLLVNLQLDKLAPYGAAK